MQYVLVAVVVAVFSVLSGRIWLRRRRERPLRREMRARDITFRSFLDRVGVIEPGWLEPQSGSDSGAPISRPVELIVRGDAFEVSSTLALGRVVLGLEYFFRACETSVELNRVVPRIYGMDDTPPRIVVRGWQAGKKIQLMIRQDDPLEIWDALTAAGAVPSPAWVTRAGEG
jgi:hypothetical protein